MNYDAHDHFPFRTLIDGQNDGFGGYHAPDDDYDFRAMISHNAPSPHDGKPILTVSLFPPVQLKTTDSKYDFNRHLNLHLDSLKSSGVCVTNVIVSQGGKNLYSFTP